MRGRASHVVGRVGPELTAQPPFRPPPLRAAVGGDVGGVASSLTAGLMPRKKRPQSADGVTSTESGGGAEGGSGAAGTQGEPVVEHFSLLLCSLRSIFPDDVAAPTRAQVAAPLPRVRAFSAPRFGHGRALRRKRKGAARRTRSPVQYAVHRSSFLESRRRPCASHVRQFSVLFFPCTVDMSSRSDELTQLASTAHLSTSLTLLFLNSTV